MKNITKDIEKMFGFLWASAGALGGYLFHAELQVGKIFFDIPAGIFVGVLVFLVLKKFFLDRDWEK